MIQKVETTKKAATSKVIEAIIKTSEAIGKLAKKDLNKFDKYNFVSIDNFLEATGPAMASNGLVLAQEELECERIERGGKPWLRFVYEFTLYHKSGESMQPARRTVHVAFTGAQSTGAAQSYALKQYMRSLFQITTGDKDDPDCNRADTSIETVTPEEIAEIKSLIEQAGSDESYILKRVSEISGYAVTSLEKVPAKVYRSRSGMKKFLKDQISQAKKEKAVDAK